jgi:hypothetical protein
VGNEEEPPAPRHYHRACDRELQTFFIAPCRTVTGATTPRTLSRCIEPISSQHGCCPRQQQLTTIEV